MYPKEVIAWTYEQLRMTGCYGMKELRMFEEMPLREASITALALFNALPRIEQIDILHRFDAFIKNQQGADQWTQSFSS